MLSVSLWILTFILILVSIFLILIVLAQKTKDGGVGSALGGGATEAAFGPETSNVLTRMTKYSAILFFVLAFVLYIGRVYERKHGLSGEGGALPNIAAPAVPPTTAPVTGVTPAPAPGVETPAPVAPAVNVQVPVPEATPAAPAPDAKK